METPLCLHGPPHASRKAYGRRTAGAVLAIAYRGYPGSTGSPSETGLLEDGNAAIAFVRKAAASSPILVHGHSMGTGVAVAMAAVHQVLGVYLEAPYASLLGLAKRQYQYLPGFLVLDPMRSDLRIGAVRAPILAIHGQQDPVIPITSARELMARVPANARLIEVTGDHDSIVGMADAEAEEQFRPTCPKGAARP
jgi:fermentation-respiration switch protein FrsA (DUF1100 family)